MDRVALATGTFEFVHNVHVPGMVHGRVVRPPEIGSTVANVDEKSVQHVPGLIKVVVRNNFVGVVAEKQWQAAQAAKNLKVTWKPGPGLPAQKDFYDYIRKQPSRAVMLVNSNDVDNKLKSASRVLKATYLHPYQAHGSMGSSCAVADVQEHHATVWSATQSVYPTLHGVSVRDLCSRLGLLRTECRGHGFVRCGAAFPGRAQTGSRATHATRRIRFRELWLRLRYRAAGWSRCERQD
jgi:nicotinate dehydrogenase subunit B